MARSATYASAPRQTRPGPGLRRGRRGSVSGMTSRLDGTVALVTGASSGIGEATAYALAAEGATIAVAARRVDRLDTLADKIRGEGGTVLVLEADITVHSEAVGVVERTVAELGRLDTVVN